MRIDAVERHGIAGADGVAPDHPGCYPMIIHRRKAAIFGAVAVSILAT
jgi:hypothetical protein